MALAACSAACSLVQEQQQQQQSYLMPSASPDEADSDQTTCNTAVSPNLQLGESTEVLSGPHQRTCLASLPHHDAAWQLHSHQQHSSMQQQCLCDQKRLQQHQHQQRQLWAATHRQQEDKVPNRNGEATAKHHNAASASLPELFAASSRNKATKKPPLPPPAAAAGSKLRSAPSSSHSTRVCAGAGADTAAGTATDSAASSDAAWHASVRKSHAAKAASTAMQEPFWNPATWAAVAVQFQQQGERLRRKVAGLQQLPEHSTATFAVVVLVHEAGWPNHDVMEAWKEAHPEGSVALFVHVKAGVQLHDSMPGVEAIRKYQLTTAIPSQWGQISLVEAGVYSAAEVLLRCPHVSHVGLASGEDVPVKRIRPGILPPGVSLYGSFEFDGGDLHTIREMAEELLFRNEILPMAQTQRWSRCMRFHHQWMVLSREHAAALYVHKADLFAVCSWIAKACKETTADMAPDEFAVLTTLMQAGCVRNIQQLELRPGLQVLPGTFINCYPTHVVFPPGNAAHPVLWVDFEQLEKCNVLKPDGREVVELLSLQQCLSQAANSSSIFFRKVNMGKPAQAKEKHKGRKQQQQLCSGRELPMQLQRDLQQQQRQQQMQMMLIQRLQSLWAGGSKQRSGGGSGGSSHSQQGSSSGSGKRRRA